MAEQYKGGTIQEILPNGRQTPIDSWDRSDIRKFLTGELPSTKEDLSSLREYVLHLSMKAHTSLTDPDTLSELYQLGFTVTRKDELLPPTNRLLQIGPRGTDGYPYVELAHRYAPISKELAIDDPDNQDLFLSSSSIDFVNHPAGFYLNAVSKNGPYGVFYVGSDSRSDTVMPVMQLPITESKVEAFYQSIDVLQSISESPEKFVRSMYDMTNESLTDKAVIKADMQDQVNFRIGKLHDALSSSHPIFERK